MKIKIFFFAAILPILLLSQGARAANDPYITSQNVYTTKTVPCGWTACHQINGVGHSYCLGICSRQWVCINAVTPIGSGLKTISELVGTNYTCNYISSVSSWSTCTNGMQVAASVVWSTKSATSNHDPSCVNVSTTRSCNVAPTAAIDLPTSATTVNYQELINFTGHGTDSDGTVANYEWREGDCSAGTLLSSGVFTSNPTASLSISSLSPTTTHTIYFRVQDDFGAWSTCDTRQITVRPVCSPMTPPAQAAFCQDDTINIPGSSNLAITEVDSNVKCSARKCEYYFNPIPGAGGSACHGTFCNKPTENLCDAGDPTEITISADGNYWIWDCAGKHGGSIESCQAVKSCAWKEVAPN